MKRRTFIQASALALTTPALYDAANLDTLPRNRTPIVISTWDFGAKANPVAMKILTAGGSSLDAVEAGVRVVEADPDVDSVGYGGLPDISGRVTLDACIMGHFGQAGAVGCIENILHPVSVARKVMENTDHVMLVGKGALEFARSQGFPEQNMLTEKARKVWESWTDKPLPRDDSNHDTIALLAQDREGNIAGACTTSGRAKKLPGRVGDSPIIGAGLYVDNSIGAAGATGLGEEVIKTAGSFLVVELMRQGAAPVEACKLALQRILDRQAEPPNFNVAFIALRKDGEIGAAGLSGSFEYVVSTPRNMETFSAPELINAK